MDRKTKAEAFGALHSGPDILILPNAWDAASAAIMEDAGAKAIATSSAAVAWAHGYPDGDALPLARLLDTVETVARVVKVPVTADIEGGYTDDLGQLSETIKAVIAAGAVGINLEDGRRDPRPARPQDRGRPQGRRRGRRAAVHQRPHRRLPEGSGRGRGGL